MRPNRKLSGALAAACLGWAGLSGCRALPRGLAPPESAAPGSVPSVASQPDPAVQRAGFLRSRSDPGQAVNVHIDLGTALEGREEYESAVAEYQQALDAINGPERPHGGARVPNDMKALAHRRMAVALDHLGRFEQAEAHYRAALKMRSGDPKLWNDLGYSYYLQRRWADSERALRTAYQHDPENPKVLTNLGMTLAYGGKTSEALELLTKAGGPAWAHHNLGVALASLGDEAEARVEFQKALEVQPQLPAPRAALAQLDRRAAAVATASNRPKAPADPRLSRTSTPKTARP
jgi:tetratricopeptide (TPR) repeat protein